MKKRLILNLLITLLMAMPITLNAQDWVIEDRDGSITYISGDWIKTIDPEEEGFTSIYNLSAGKLILINTDTESYSEGSLDDYCQALNEMTSSMMEGMTPEQKEMMEAYMSQSNSGPAPEVKIESRGAGENIAGYSTEKYAVMVDGELYEEVWISSDEALMKLVDLYKKMEPMTMEMVKCSAMEINLDNDPDFSEAYLDLMHKGMELKSVRHEYGSPEPGTDIIRVEKTSIPASEFKPPANFKKVDFQPFLAPQEDMD